MDISTFVISLIGGIVGGFFLSYFQKKGENFATKSDIEEITKKVEDVKTHYAKELELYKNDIRLLEKRRDLSSQVIDLINRYKELSSGDEKQLRKFEQDYYKLIPWIPTEILKALNLLFSRSVALEVKPDTKDVIVAVRKAILKDDSGDFTGTDIIHFVGFAKNLDEK